jgi:hypothetical protein
VEENLMSDQVVIELFKKALLDCLKETFERVSGIYLDGGTSLFETLEGVSAEEASRPSPGGGATLAAQVEHVRFYLDVLNEVMQKQVVTRVDWREIWQRVRGVTQEEWEGQKRGLRESYQRVVETVTRYDKWQSEYGISGSLAVLAHTAYHLGGIRHTLHSIKPVPPRP